MEPTNRSNVSIILVDPESQLRQGLRNALLAEGFRGVRDFSRLDRAEEEIRLTSPDLLVIDAKMPEGDAAGMIRDIRNRKIGYNPFFSIIVTIWNPDPDEVRRIVDVGIDDLLIKPLAPAQLLERIKVQVENRKPFVVTSDYVGPDRRKQRTPTEDEVADGAAGSEIPLIDVPNTLRSKALGKFIDPAALDAAIDSAVNDVNEQRLKRHSYQIAFLINLIVPAYTEGAVDPATEVHLARLIEITDEVGDRLAGSSFEHVADLCQTLIDVVHSIRRDPLNPDPKDVELLGSLANAVLVGFNPEKGSAVVAGEITAMVRKFAARAKADALRAADTR